MSGDLLVLQARQHNAHPGCHPLGCIAPQVAGGAAAEDAVSLTLIAAFCMSEGLLSLQARWHDMLTLWLAPLLLAPAAMLPPASIATMAIVS